MNSLQHYFSENSVDVNKMAGQWFIQKTSLNFWRNRFSPTVTYTVESNAGKMKILDEVRYFNKHGVAKEVVGYDSLIQNKNGHFLWQGKPWYLRFLKSEWGVVAHDENYSDWAVTFFSKTLFTPEGVDIYTREDNLSDVKYTEILHIMSEIELLKPYVDKLYQTKKS